MIDALSIDRFHDLVAGYGADPDRWPANQRSAAIRSIADCEAARTAWRDAAALDADLDTLPGVDMSPELAEKVIAIAKTPERPTNDILSGAARHALPYAAAAAIALVIGLNVPSPFRDATGTALQTGTASTEPVIIEETNDDLTTLALVDVRTFADDNNVIDDAEGDENELSGLPLL